MHQCSTACSGQPSQTKVTLKMSNEIFFCKINMNTLAFTPGFVINAIALWWLVSLDRKGCSCGADWRRQYLKYWYGFALVAPLLLFLIGDCKYLLPFTGLVGVAGLLAFFALASFLWDIERRPCPCAQDWREKLLLLTTILGVVGLFVGVAAALMARRQ